MTDVLHQVINVTTNADRTATGTARVHLCMTHYREAVIEAAKIRQYSPGETMLIGGHELVLNPQMPDEISPRAEICSP